jgi:serine/threonine protein kinase
MIGDLFRVRYEIIEPLSSSAIFDNFVAKDRISNTMVCLRVLREPYRSQPEFVAALASVVEKTKVLDHPNIARCYAIDEHEQVPFIVCDLVHGSVLSEKIRRVAPFTPAVAVDMAIDIAESLESALRVGVVHGDLCSDHVMTTLEGKCYVLDFGFWESYGASESAGAAVLPRMAPYLSPEVIDGQLPNAASDVYALGVILFELLTGRSPFTGSTPMSILSKHSTQPAPSARLLNPAVPPVLDEIVQKCLSKDVHSRYSDATTLLGDLRALRDALRFGKQLKWPIHREIENESHSISQEKKGFGSVVHEQSRESVKLEAPASGVVEKKASLKLKKIKEARDDDVPMWLRAVVYMLSGMLIIVVVGWMVMNLSRGREVIVPNLVGMTMAEARMNTDPLKLKLSVVGEEYSDRYSKPETIIWMDPAPQTPVRENSFIQVRISLGSLYVEVPELRGMTLSEAARTLKAANLRLDPAARKRSDETIPEGQIIETNPRAGEKVERNTDIEVTVSTGKKEPDRPRVNTEDMLPNQWSLKFRVQDSDQDVLVRVEMTDARGESLVIFEETRAPGSEVSLESIEGFGKRATFRIYFNNYLDTTITRKGLEE